MRKTLSEMTPEIAELAKLCAKSDIIDASLYEQYDVKRGLRDINGKGGGCRGLPKFRRYARLKKRRLEKKFRVRANLYMHRGYNIKSLVSGFLSDGRFGFAETAYLLLFGELPTAAQLDKFTSLLGKYWVLPVDFVRDIILKAPSSDMMSTLLRS